MCFSISDKNISVQGILVIAIYRPNQLLKLLGYSTPVLLI